MYIRMTLSASFRGAQITSIEEEIERSLHKEGVKPGDLKSLNLADNELSSLFGLEKFVNLTSLDLSYNRLEILRCIPENITRLSVSHNKLVHIFGLEKLVNLYELDMSYNLLEDMTGLIHNTQIRVLCLSGNRIKQVGYIEHLGTLESLELEDNLIKYIDDLRSLSYNVNLKNLWLKGNPVERLAFYKYACRNLIPTLITLDGNKLGSTPRNHGVKPNNSSISKGTNSKKPKISSNGHSKPSKSKSVKLQQDSFIHNEEERADGNNLDELRVLLKQLSTVEQQRKLKSKDGTKPTKSGPRSSNAHEKNKKEPRAHDGEVHSKAINSPSSRGKSHKDRMDNHIHSRENALDMGTGTDPTISISEVLKYLDEVLTELGEEVVSFTPQTIQALLEEHFVMDLSEHAELITKIVNAWIKNCKDKEKLARFRKVILALIVEKQKLLEEFEQARKKALEESWETISSSTFLRRSHSNELSPSLRNRNGLESKRSPSPMK